MHAEVSCGDITILCSAGTFPQMYAEYRSHALLADEIDLSAAGGLSFFGVVRGSGWPFLTVAQRYTPSEAGFIPGALYVPETSVLFVGAGERLLAYDLAKPRRLWTDHADCGFWRWRRHEDHVLMCAEIEFAAWSLDGQKKWATFVEPPWDFDAKGSTVKLDVMGRISSFDLRHGPESKNA
jgi:hypothetical protein